MNIREKFCKYSKHPCPDCGSKMQILDIINDDGGVSYTYRREICDECGYENDITDKRSNNNKVEIKEVDLGKSNSSNKRYDASPNHRR